MAVFSLFTRNVLDLLAIHPLHRLLFPTQWSAAVDFSIFQYGSQWSETRVTSHFRKNRKNAIAALPHFIHLALAEKKSITDYARTRTAVRIIISIGVQAKDQFIVELKSRVLHLDPTQVGEDTVYGLIWTFTLLPREDLLRLRAVLSLLVSMAPQSSLLQKRLRELNISPSLSSANFAPLLLRAHSSDNGIRLPESSNRTIIPMASSLELLRGRLERGEIALAVIELGKRNSQEGEVSDSDVSQCLQQAYKRLEMALELVEHNTRKTTLLFNAGTAPRKKPRRLRRERRSNYKLFSSAGTLTRRDNFKEESIIPSA